MRLIRGDTIAKILAIFVVGLFSFGAVSAVAPSGATFTPVDNQTAPADSPNSHAAIAGNVTQITVTGYTTTQTWQGYYGNVTGTIQLTNNNDDVLYNWSLANPQGEIYASRDGSVAWTRIQCMNLTGLGTDKASCNSAAGGTCATGMNVTQLEGYYSIVSDDVDGVDETFFLTDGSGYTHSSFYTNNLLFSSGECPSVHLRGNNGAIADANYEEVLLYDPTGDTHAMGAPVFASLLEETSVNGFDGADYDFEMLVLEDGHGTNTATTTYYFYVELQ